MNMIEETYSDLEPEECPDCGSNHTRTDSLFNWHKCEDCSAMWGFDKDDPDYDEIDPIQDIEAISQLTKNLDESHLLGNF